MIEFDEPISVEFPTCYGVIDKGKQNFWEFEIYDDGEIYLERGNRDMACILYTSIDDLEELVRKAKWFREKRNSQ